MFYLHACAMDIEEVGPSNAVQAVAAEVDLREHPSGIVPQLQNVVATINLDVKLDLKQVAMHARNAEYNPKVRVISSWATLP